MQDVEGYQNFVSKEISEMQANGEESDCADLACKLLIRYASSEGLEVEFTKTDGTKINSTKDSSNSPEEFEAKVNGSTNAESTQNDMNTLVNEVPSPGDVTNDGFHVNVVTERAPNTIYENGTIPTTSGSIPSRVPKNSSVLLHHKTFKRWKPVSDAHQRKWHAQKAEQRKRELKGNF